MAIPAFKTTHVPDDAPASTIARLVNAVVGDLRQFLDRVKSNRELDGVTQTVTLQTLSNTTINHKLGRKPVDWTYYSPNAATTIYEVSRSATQLVLYSSATVTVTLKVW